MKHFNNCKTYEELKQEYKRLAMIHHPDKGGSTAAMQEINNSYEEAFKILKDIHRSKEGDLYNKATQDNSKTYPDIINKIIFYEGCTIEICGSWVWVSGETKRYKEQLKELKFKWSSNKSAWYFHTDAYRKYTNKPMSKQDIRYMFGSEEVETQTRQKIS